MLLQRAETLLKRPLPLDADARAALRAMAEQVQRSVTAKVALAGLVARATELKEDASLAAFYLISLALGVTDTRSPSLAVTSAIASKATRISCG